MIYFLFCGVGILKRRMFLVREFVGVMVIILDMIFGVEK